MNIERKGVKQFENRIGMKGRLLFVSQKSTRQQIGFSSTQGSQLLLATREADYIKTLSNPVMLLRPSDSSGKGPNSSKGSILVRTHTFVTIQLVRELTSKGKERAKQRGSALGAPSQPVNSPLKFLSPSSPRLFAFDYQSIIINQENPSIIPLIQSPKHPIFKPLNLFPSPRHPKIEPSKMPMPMPTPSPPTPPQRMRLNCTPSAEMNASRLPRERKQGF